MKACLHVLGTVVSGHPILPRRFITMPKCTFQVVIDFGWFLPVTAFTVRVTSHFDLASMWLIRMNR
jgi:hypothetical protein